MDVMMEEVAGELEISGCSSTTTSPSSSSSLDHDMGLCAWNGLSPVADWGPFFSGDGGQDLHGLIESMLSDEALAGDDLQSAMFFDDPYYSNGSSNPGSTTTTNPGTPVHDDPPDCPEKGLRLLHLLMAVAEALSGPHKSRELARVILVRLKEMVSGASAAASNMERLAAHFTDALQALLDGSHHAGGAGKQAAAAAAAAASSHHHHHAGDVLTAFQMLQDMSPYIKFGHFTANQAILEAVAADRRVHVVDYDIAEGIQWASLMQAMASRPDGAPPPHLRITAVSRGGGARAVQEAGRRLAAFAESVGQAFSFGQCRLDSDERFRPVTVRMVKGETLVANCVLHQAAAASTIRRPTGSVASFLTGMAALGAKVVTMVEEEGEAERDDDDAGDAAAAVAAGSFVSRFMEELHRYSAVWDSLEAGFPTQSRVRGLVERVILAPNIAGAVSRAYRGVDGGGDGEGRGGWGEWMRGSGFKGVQLSCFNHSQARLLLGLFNDGYTVEETGPNKIVLGWKARRLLSASVWAPPPPPSAPSSPQERVAPASAAGGFGRTEFDYIDSFLVEPAYALV